MKEELDKRLVTEFPNLYEDRDAGMMSTAMCWGFECSDGWFDLIYDLSSKLEPLIVKYREENPDDDYYPRASQVKEKYGTLRFYMSTSTNEMDKFIEEAEDKSGDTCETCGAKGKTRRTGWVITLCDKHHEERQS